jgi:hypothetical protein
MLWPYGTRATVSLLKKWTREQPEEVTSCHMMVVYVTTRKPRILPKWRSDSIYAGLRLSLWTAATMIGHYERKGTAKTTELESSTITHRACAWKC